MKDDRSPAIRVAMMPRDTNGHGTIFGGVLLSYIDQAGAVAAHSATSKMIVTVAMDQVDFKSPVFVGDLVSYYAEVTATGTTSVTCKVDVVATRGLLSPMEERGTDVPVTEAVITYVAVDDDRLPVAL